MNLDAVITQLRTFCPLLEGRVAGAADFDTGIETVMAMTDPGTGALVYPSAAVYPLEDETSNNTSGTGLTQAVTETIGVVVEFDATPDRRGQAGVHGVEPMKYALFAALLNWHIDPDRSSKGIYYAGGELMTFDRARLFWVYRFSFDATITDADGFQIRGDPLIEVEGTIQPPDAPSPVQPVVIRASGD